MPKAALRYARFEWVVPERDEKAFCANLQDNPAGGDSIPDLPAGFVLHSLEVLAAQQPGHRLIRAAYSLRDGQKSQ